MPDGSDPLDESVAWLRLLPATGMEGVCMGLLEATPSGQPLRFGFTAFAIPGAKPQATSPARLQAACASLLGGSLAPRLIFVHAGEVTKRMAAAMGMPVYRISDGTLAAGDSALAWVKTASPMAECGLGAVMRSEDAFAPAERVAHALALACEDSRVHGMIARPGLATFVMVPFSAAETASVGDLAVEDDLAAALRRLLTPPSRPHPPLPAESWSLAWPNQLMPYQHEGVRVLLEMDRLLLADDMGLGKTVQAVAALRILRARGELGKALVVAPTGVLDQWRRELAKWAPALSALVVRGSAADRIWQWRADVDVTLASYGVMRSDGGRAEVRGRRWGVVVTDEAQRIKNRVETSEAVKALSRRRSWALTGTPIENREEELASIMEFVDHDGSAPLKRFRPGQALQARHREVQLRRRKGDVLAHLPPKVVTTLHIELAPAQRASYDRAERDGIVYLRSLGTDVGIVHVLELITRLKQICNADPRTGASSKLDDIVRRLDELTAQGHKALVFSQYTSASAGVALAAHRLARFNPLVLTGDTPVPERTRLIDAFKVRARHRAMVVSLRAGGLGLNLQEASYVFHLDRWWNPAVERQAEDRVHRIGQTVKTHAIKYTTANTIEERIEKIIETKQALFDELVDDVSLDLTTRLSREDLLSLFGL